MKEWRVCHQMIHPMQPLYFVRCKEDGRDIQDNRIYASRDEAWKHLKKLKSLGVAGRTEWRIGCHFVKLTIPLYQVCYRENGVIRTAPDVYPTHEAAQKDVNEMAAKEKAPEAADTAQGAKE